MDEKQTFEIKNILNLSPESAADIVIKAIDKLNKSQAEIDEYRAKSFIEKTFTNKNDLYLNLHNSHNENLFKILALIQILTNTQNIQLDYLNKLKDNFRKLYDKQKQQGSRLGELEMILQIMEFNINARDSNSGDSGLIGRTLKKFNRSIMLLAVSNLFLVWFVINMLLIIIGVNPLGTFESYDSVKSSFTLGMFLLVTLLYLLLSKVRKRKLLLENVKRDSYYCPICNKVSPKNHVSCTCGYVFEDIT